MLCYISFHIGSGMDLHIACASLDCWKKYVKTYGRSIAHSMSSIVDLPRSAFDLLARVHVVDHLCFRRYASRNNSCPSSVATGSK